MKSLKRIAPWILMAAYLPLLVAMAFHTHEPEKASHHACHECTAHQAHSSHMGGTSTSINDCLFCQLASSSYFHTQGIAATPASFHVAGTIAVQSCSVCCRQEAIPSLRAPPEKMAS